MNSQINHTDNVPIEHNPQKHEDHPHDPESGIAIVKE